MATRPGSVDLAHDLVNGKVKGDLPMNDVVMTRSLLAGAVGATDVEPTDDGTYKTTIRAGLLGAWRAAADDPDDQLEVWSKSGAPAGIRHLPLRRCVFPPVDDEADDPELLGSFEEDYHWRDIDNGDVAIEKFTEYEAKGYVESFDSFKALVHFLGGERPVISDVHVVA